MAGIGDNLKKLIILLSLLIIPSFACAEGGSHLFGIPTKIQAYGQLFVSYNVTATPVTANTYTTVTVNVEACSLKRMTYLNNGLMQVDVHGAYLIVASMSFSDGNINVFHGGISINEAEPLGSREFSRKLNANGDIGVASMVCIVPSLVVGDTVGIQVENTTDGSDPTIQYMNVSMVRIGP